MDNSFQQPQLTLPASVGRRPDPAIYGYYEDPSGGNKLRWYYDLCWQTVTTWTPGAVLLSRKSAEEIVGRFPPEVDSLYVAHRADWLRKAIIARTGGMWVDVDFICWTDLSPLAAGCAAFDYVGFKEWRGGWMDNFFGARPSSPIVAEMASHALGRVRSGGGNRSWLALSGETVEHVLKKHPWSLVLQLPTYQVQPFAIWEYGFMFKDCDQPDQAKWWKCFGHMTSLHCLRDHLAQRFSGPEEFLKSKCWLAAIMRRGLRI